MSVKKQNPSYYATIPANVRYDRDLKANEKLLYGEITCLSNKKGYCWANNNYFAELFNVTPETVSRWISGLDKKGYIKREIIKDEKGQVKERKLYINAAIPSCSPVDENVKGGIDENVKGGIDKKIKDNNTSKTSNITSKEYKDYTPVEKTEQEKSEIPFEKIVEYLNHKTDSSYRHTTKKTRRKIRARYNEGFNFSDFLTVIDKKTAEWTNTHYAKYLRPETLFGTKFEGYLNQPWPDDYDDDPEGFDQLKEIWGELEEEEEFIDG